FLPLGTLTHVATVRDVLEQMPLHLSKHVRQFRMHQYADGNFELRVATKQPLPAEFAVRLQQAWRASVGTQPIALKIVEVEQIARGSGEKFQAFTSDFAPRMECDNGPEGASLEPRLPSI